MDATNESSPDPDELVNNGSGSKDGASAADHDQPYRFGRRPNARAPYPFSERQYARLLVLRSHVRALESVEDRAA
jgi:uncharacterized Fe-S cluster-containing radical SAM superfamily enzyme